MSSTSMEWQELAGKKRRSSRCIDACLAAFYIISALVLLYFVSWLLIGNGTFAAEHQEEPHAPEQQQQEEAVPFIPPQIIPELPDVFSTVLTSTSVLTTSLAPLPVAESSSVLPILPSFSAEPLPSEGVAEPTPSESVPESTASPFVSLGDFVEAGPYAVDRKGTQFPGFDSLQHLFVFGDSYSATGFDPNGAQPSESNPIGNPDFPGATNTNGWNWVNYLVKTYNTTYLAALDFAVGGATVDEKILQIGHVGGLTGMTIEIEKEFLVTYANPSVESPVPWTSDSSMFFIWIGINDIGNAEDISELAASMQRYIALADSLYTAGARNFMFINVPPIHRTPHAVREGVEERWEAWTEEWNGNITELAVNLTQTYPDTTAILFDAYELFNDAIDNPGQFPESSSFKDTTGFCSGFVFGTEAWNATDPDCDYAANEYLWMNDLHPTTVMHNVTAHEVAKALQNVA